MNKQDALKLQTCVLRVNIQCDCEGCHQKVKKTLQKIDGVRKVNVDVEQGKVTVLGNVDPSTLIKKLDKAGKHAEVWGGQKGQIPDLSAQFKNMLMEKAIGGKDGNNKPQKGGKPQFLVPQNNKGQKFDKKNFKPLVPEDDEDDDEFDEDEFDDEDDEFDDDDVSEDSFEDHHHHHHHQKPAIKLPTVPRGGGGHGVQGNNVSLNSLVKDNNGANNGGKAKKGGGGFDMMFLKGMLGKSGSKKGKEGKDKEGKGKSGNQGKGGGKMEGHHGKEESKKNGDKEEAKNHSHKNGSNGKDGSNWSKKGGKNTDGVPKMDNVGFSEGMNQNHKGNGQFVMGQRPNFPMGQMANIQGLPMMNGGGGGHFQGVGVGQGYPYEQQQYNMPWMMNQGNGQNMYHPLMMRSHPPPGYGPPPPGNDRYTHMFDDENPNSCSIM